MNREWFIFTIGMVIFFFPLLGFPRGFAIAVYIIAGALLWLSALRELRKIYRRKRQEEHDAGTPTI